MHESKILKLRSEINKKGYVLIRKFADPKTIRSIRKNWINNDLNNKFNSFVRNVDVDTNTEHYMYNRPTDLDAVYCINFFKPPICEILHTYALKIQLLRNQLEDIPLYEGIAAFSSRKLQYRICKTISKKVAVKPHADFFLEKRKDPTAKHEFDPNRYQATLFLSEYNKDYRNGGLFFHTKPKKINISKKLKVKIGDLLIWKYNLKHSVSNINKITDAGFLRIIYPTFIKN